MNPWPKYAFFRLLLPYVIGILVRIYLFDQISVTIIIFVTLLVALVVLSFLPKLLPYKLRTVYGLLLFLLMFTVAYQQCDKKLDVHLPNDLFESKHHLLFEVIEEPIERENSVKIIARLMSVKLDSDYQEIDQKVILYLEKDPLRESIRFGDFVITEAILQQINSPLNPYEFNYKRYLSYHQINAQIYLKNGTFKIIPSQNISIKRGALNSRDYVVSYLESSGLKGDILAVASAILLGYDELLDPELQQQFSAAGAMHILCVSGLHVGVIYLLFNSMLAFLLKFKGGSNLRAIIVLCLIWMYALVTGFSPSVLRASYMLSFAIVGVAINRKGNVYNSLAASAFTLLLINPLMITEVGFQLSYAAVLGIVSLHKPIKSIWLPDQKILDKFWSIAIISIAAQLATFPIAIYYFHQFPTYFLLSNLFVVLLAGFIINVGFVSIILMKVPFISMILSKILSFLILILNTIVQKIENLPFSVISGLVINLAEIVLFYVLMISLFKMIQTKLKSGFVITGLCVLLLVISFSCRNFNFQLTRKIVFYQINKHIAIDFINNQKNVLLVDSLLLLEKQKINYHILNNQLYSGLKTSNYKLMDHSFQDQNLCFYKKGNWIQFYKYRIWIASEVVPKIQADFVILRNNPKCDLRDIINQMNPKGILIYSENYKRNIDHWQSIANANNVDVYIMKEEGALTIEF